MIHAFRVLLLVLAVEMVVGGALVGMAAWRTVAQVPDVELNDPLIMPQLREIAANAESGAARDWSLFGEALLGKGFYGHAELAFREALRMDPEAFDAQFGLAFSLDRTGRMYASSQEYQKVLQLPSLSQEQERNKFYALYAMGRNALRQESPDEGEELFRRNAGFAPADYQLAKLLIRSGRAEEAMSLIRQSLVNIPYSLEFHFLDQRAHRELGEPRKAFEAAAMVERSAYLVSMNFNTDYVAPLDQRTGIAPLVNKLGEAAERQNWDRVEALGAQIKTLLGDDPVFAGQIVSDRLLQAALHKKQPERALEIIAHMRETGREDAVTLEGEGDAQKMLGEREHAAGLWKRALKLSPSISLHEKLASYFAESEPELRDRHLSEVALLRGIKAYRSNRLRGAIPHLEEAARLDPEASVPWFYLGEMYFHLNEREAASEAYKACLERQPTHGRARQKLEYLRGT